MSQSLSEQYFNRSRQITPGGVHSPVRAFKNVNTYPRFIAKAQGPYLYDCDGQRYIDYCMAWGPMILGHCDEEVKSAVEEAMGQGWSFGTAEPRSLELAELMTSHLPWVESLRFVTSGTEAVMSALRVARAATGRAKILKFDGCYHGHCDSMLVRAGSGLAEMSSPDSAGVTALTASETVVVPLDDIRALTEVLEQQGKEIAAIIVEPIPANNGLLIPKNDFLAQLRKLTLAHDCLLIFDEVITGFRVKFGGMAEISDVRPDLVTYGKVIGGGFPVGAFGGRRDLMELVAPAGPVYQAGTLSANPIAMASGLATLKKLLRLNPYEKLHQQTQKLAKDLAIVAQRESEFEIQVAQFASLFWLALGKSGQAIRAPSQIDARQKTWFAHLYPEVLKRGVYLPPSGYEVGFLSMAHSSQQDAVLVEAFEGALKSDTMKKLRLG